MLRVPKCRFCFFFGGDRGEWLAGSDMRDVAVTVEEQRGGDGTMLRAAEGERVMGREDGR